MGRARGKHGTGREPQAFIDPDSPEAHEIGAGQLEEHPLPGGRPHLSNPETFHSKPVVADEPLPEFRGWLAHGVPPEHHGVRDRDLPSGPRQRDHRRPYQPKPEDLPKRPVPVPVVIVQDSAGPRPLKHVSTRHFQVPAIGGEPESICGQDLNRISVKILNEGITSGLGVRIGQLTELTYDAANSLITGGALLPNSMTSYLKIETQGPLYVMSMDSKTPYLSIIIETEIAGAG